MLLVFVLLVLAGLLIAPLGHACAPAWPPNERVDIASEEALIAYEPHTKTQHFVRRASFRTEAKDFGFLVPTPSRPDLAESPDELFDRLARRIEPEVQVRVERQLALTSLFALTLGAAAPEQAAPIAAAVQVLEQKRVAGYDATVLQASDAEQLAEWLKKQGYPYRPELARWLEPYVEKKWIVTAFKIAKGSGDERIATAAVRMSFTTERPFFPYREPEDLRQTQNVAGAARLLRLYLIADARLVGELAHPQGFPGETMWAGPLDDAPKLLGDVVDFTLPKAPVLTVIEDRAAPRPGIDDVYFGRAADQSPIYPPPVIRSVTRDIPIFIELILLVGAAMFGLFVFFRRRARGAR